LPFLGFWDPQREYLTNRSSVRKVIVPGISHSVRNDNIIGVVIPTTGGIPDVTL
jgi:hypothetical protein